MKNRKPFYFVVEKQDNGMTTLLSPTSSYKLASRRLLEYAQEYPQHTYALEFMYAGGDGLIIYAEGESNQNT